MIERKGKERKGEKVTVKERERKREKMTYKEKERKKGEHWINKETWRKEGSSNGR